VAQLVEEEHADEERDRGRQPIGTFPGEEEPVEDIEDQTEEEPELRGGLPVGTLRRMQGSPRLLEKLLLFFGLEGRGGGASVHARLRGWLLLESRRSLCRALHAPRP
jgi:hypothetical protein